MNRRLEGLSLIEVLIALAVIGVAFAAMAMVQVNNLRATARSSLLTEVKAAANLQLEQTTAEVLKAVTLTYCSGNPLCDQEDKVGTTPRYLSFKFIDYYHYCAPGAWDDGLRNSYRSQTSTTPAPDDAVTNCNGTRTIDGVNLEWSIHSPGATDVTGEGLLEVTVTATHTQGQKLTVGNAITCYDVYPAPKKETPRPCPQPEIL